MAEAGRAAGETDRGDVGLAATDATGDAGLGDEGLGDEGFGDDVLPSAHGDEGLDDESSVDIRRAIPDAGRDGCWAASRGTSATAGLTRISSGVANSRGTEMFSS